MMDSASFRAQVASQLEAAVIKVPQLSAFVGLDGFVDEILHVVDKRHSADRYDRLRTITEYSARLGAAAGKSTNVELVNIMTKLGGNGPIMANAWRVLGSGFPILGRLDFRTSSCFRRTFKEGGGPQHQQSRLTDALEFEDGKIMVGKHYMLRDVNWANIKERFGVAEFRQRLGQSTLVAFVNWTMLPFMSEIWESVLAELAAYPPLSRQTIFFDLADPEKRLPEDILRALDIIQKFERYFDVILGLNEKEAHEIQNVLGLSRTDSGPEALLNLSREIHARICVNTLVVHPVAYAIAVGNGCADTVWGPVCLKPRITTGAGDHFNSGFCLGRLLGLDNAASLLCGVGTSGHYVRTAQSPTVTDLVQLMLRWPEN
jgi:hypothetical protein